MEIEIIKKIKRAGALLTAILCLTFGVFAQSNTGIDSVNQNV